MGWGSPAASEVAYNVRDLPWLQCDCGVYHFRAEVVRVKIETRVLPGLKRGRDYWGEEPSSSPLGRVSQQR